MICDYFVDEMILIANEMTFELAPQYPQRLPEPSDNGNVYKNTATVLRTIIPIMTKST